MTIVHSTFISALNTAAQLLNGRNTVCKSYYFTGERLVTTDLDRIASIPFATDFSCAVAPDKLLAYVKSLPADSNIELVYEKDVSLTIKCGKAKAKFAVIPNGVEDIASFIDVINTSEFVEFTIDTDKFFSVYHTVAQHASTDPTRRVLQGVYMCTDDKQNLQLTSTDGRTLASVDIGAIGDTFKAIVMPNFIKLLKDEVITDYSISDRFFSFKCASGSIFCGRMIDGVYPNYKQVIPTDVPHKLCLPEDYKVYLKRAALVSDTLQLDATETECTITATNENTSYTETFAVTSSAELSIIFKVDYLLRLLEFSNVMQFTDGASPVMCSTETATSVAMPLRAA